MSVDFAELKKRVDIVQVAEWLGIEGKKNGEQIRSKCPKCDNKSERSLVITPSKQLFYVFCCQRGGDLIELAAFVKGIGQKQAAEEIGKAFTVCSTPEEPAGEGFEGLKYLEPGHAAVEALGLPKEVAEAIGAGFAGKGVMRGRVCLALRTEKGKIVAYIGINEALDPIVKLPSKFHL